MVRFKGIVLSYFISYMVVVLPVLVISFGVTQLSGKRFVQKEEQIIQRQLDMLADDMDNWFQNHFENSVVLLQDIMFSSRYVLEDSGQAAETIAFLHKIKLFDIGITDIFVYYGNEALYGANGKCRPSAYFRDTLGCPEDIAVTAQKFIGSSEVGIILLSNSKSESYLLYHYPISEGGYREYCSINYLMPVSYWKEQTQMIFEGTPIILRLNIGTDNVILVENLEVRENNHFITLKSEIGTNDMSLELIFDTRVSYQELREFQKLNTCLLLIGMLLSMVASISMSHRGSKRIVQFRNMVKNKEILIPSKRFFSNNFDYIQELFVQLLKENTQIDAEMQKSQQIMLTQTAKLLFHGLLKDNYTIRQMLRNLGREMFEEYYFMYGLQFDNNEIAQSYVKEHEEQLHEMIVLEKGRAIIYLEELPALDPLGEQRRERALRVIHKMKNGQKADFVGISQVYQDLSMANCAFLEVASLLEHASSLKNEIICWENYVWDSNAKVIQMPEDLLDDFSCALENQKLEEAKQILTKIRNFIHVAAVSEENKSYYRYCIIQRILTELRKEEREDLHQISAKIIRMTSTEEDDFYKKTEYFLQKICNESGLEHQFAKAVAYVEANYCRYDLSLEEIAEVAGVSKTHMSKLFKSRTGIRYIDYLTKLRMEKAKFLLEETDITIKEILLQVGYIDKTNFSKKFKEYFGVNASMYRKQVRDQEMEEKE